MENIFDHGTKKNERLKVTAANKVFMPAAGAVLL
jgi:hypothetical protein